jgi:putative transposase
MGIAVFASLSDGTSIKSAHYGKKAMKALKKAQRSLSRKKKGSNNRKKAVKKVQKLHLKVKNARKDFIEKASTTIANNHGVVYMEDLKLKNMTKTAKGTKAKPGRRVRQKSGLNRSILDQGWGMFRMMLERKLSERGGMLVLVNPAYTSQTCSVCGVIDAKSRVTQARFFCTGCGHEANADTNASLNILRRGSLQGFPRGQDMSLKRVEKTYGFPRGDSC